MSKAIRRAVTFRIALYAGFAAFIVAVDFELRRLGQIPFTASEATWTTSDELTMVTTMGNIIISLSTALFGALGLLLVNGPKVKRGLWPKAVAIASGASAAISIYFGYLLYQTALELMSHQISNLDLPAVLWTRQYQFFTFLFAVVFFGDFAIDTFFLEGGSDSKPDSACP
jgi:hypothetical protein